MTQIKDTYKTIAKPCEQTLFKDRNSKFFGYAFPVSSEEDIKLKLEELRKKHHSARHHCYAWQLGTNPIRFRANDDGEPNNSAGQPIYGQIQAFDLTNILVVSVRYFGGVKLGVGGLINAYKNSAQLAIEASEIVEKIIESVFELQFGYDMISKVQRVIKERNITIISQRLEFSCTYRISIRNSEADQVFNIFKQMYKVEIKSLN